MVEELVQETGNWRREKGFDTGWHNFAEKLMLIVTEVDEVREAKDKLSGFWFEMSHPCMSRGEAPLEPKGLAKMEDVYEDFSATLANYVEEWVDVIVRTFDLCEACCLSPVVQRRSGDDAMLLMSGISVADISRGPVGVGRILEAIRCLSGAMEDFRDVKMAKENSDGVSLVVPEFGDEKTEAKVKSIEEWLSGVVSVCTWAIEDLGVSWTDEYAKKMNKNEGRAPKHGRER
jgi:NTP pyrophosphatase (non-canonical NTP hydrolase)